ncbi:MAG: hypothetical protein QXH56_08225 [Thermoprotei archaeon]
MRIDLGCGRRCRGDIGVTLAERTPAGRDDTHTHLDRYFEEYGFTYNPNAQIHYEDVEVWVKQNSVAGHSILLSHTLEHLKHPYDLLSALGDAQLIVIVVPNARTNDADQHDDGHLYSWTKWSLENLLNNTLKDRTKRVVEIVGGLDLMAVVT